MDDLILYEEYMEYTRQGPDRDCNGGYGHYLIDQIIKKCGGVNKLEKYLMIKRAV